MNPGSRLTSPPPWISSGPRLPGAAEGLAAGGLGEAGPSAPVVRWSAAGRRGDGSEPLRVIHTTAITPATSRHTMSSTRARPGRFPLRGRGASATPALRDERPGALDVVLDLPGQVLR